MEEAVLTEFDRITERGGVLGAMERMYQRNKIQEESLYYEHQKHTGELPIVGVNTFLNKKGSPTIITQRSDPKHNGRKRTADTKPCRLSGNEMKASQRKCLKKLKAGCYQ